MNDHLMHILQRKQQEIQNLECSSFLKEVNCKRKIKSFSQIIEQKRPGIIAELKRASPSKGAIASIKDPANKAKEYIMGNCCAISVLTDEGFNGSLIDLKQVSDAISNEEQAVLRKDFILSPLQILESIRYGADAVLLIVKILGQRTAALLDFAHHAGIEAIVEVHNKDELDIALAANAKIIGINQRDLSNFSMDFSRLYSLIKYIPSNILKVAESGISEPQQAHDLFNNGFDAILVGEALSKANNPAELIKQMRL